MRNILSRLSLIIVKLLLSWLFICSVGEAFPYLMVGTGNFQGAACFGLFIGLPIVAFVSSTIDSIGFIKALIKGDETKKTKHLKKVCDSIDSSLIVICLAFLLGGYVALGGKIGMEAGLTVTPWYSILILGCLLLSLAVTGKCVLGTRA